MAYYISYISRNGSASVMLTEHFPPHEPKITHQVALYPEVDPEYFTTLPGKIVNKPSAEIILTETGEKTYHKTWQISKF